MATVGVEKAFKVRLNGDYEVVRRNRGEGIRDGETSPFADPAANQSVESVVEPPYEDAPPAAGVGLAK